MTKLYFLVFLAIITVSLGCGIPSKTLLKSENDNKDVNAENAARVARQDNPPLVESEKSKEPEESKGHDKQVIKDAEKTAEDISDKLNKKVSDEIKDEIANISEHHPHSDSIQPAGETVRRVHGLIKTLSGNRYRK